MEVEAEAVGEARGFHGCGTLSSGYKLVPWSSWAQWRAVRDGLFSPSPAAVAAALRRIAAWRSRGSLPIPVDVTAAFVEIQQKDPFFRSAMAGDAALESKEMLAMLYSMAIMRLVNGFVEHPHKKTGRSISELAEAVGIPRVLVDIRHESSHRNLPSLRLLRLAAIKAFDWLKRNYWEPQTNAIPDVQVELRSKLHELAYLLKAKGAKKSSLGSKRKRSEKSISKTIKYVARIYSAYPSEVVSVLLDFFQLDALESLDSMYHQQSGNLDYSCDVHISSSDVKTIISKLSSKEPKLMFSLLKRVLEMIEGEEALEHEGEFCTLAFNTSADRAKIRNLCSLVLWLVRNINALKDSGCIGLVHEIGVLSSARDAVPRFCLAKLLQKCLSLSILGERCLIDAALVLLEMLGNDKVKEKLKKLPSLSVQTRSPEDPSTRESGTVHVEEDSIEKATEKLEMFKLQLKKRKHSAVAVADTVDEKTRMRTMSNVEKSSRWSVTKSWIPCPFGMLPCSFSSTAVLPVLDVVDTVPKADIPVQDADSAHDGYTGGSSSCSHLEQLDDESISKRSPDYEISDISQSKSPLEGRLLISGVWKRPSKEELLSLKSKPKFLLEQ